MIPASIESEVLAMPTADRTALVCKVLPSLEELPQAELAALWLDEAQRRAAGIDSGMAELVPADEVARKARPLLSR